MQAAAGTGERVAVPPTSCTRRNHISRRLGVPFDASEGSNRLRDRCAGSGSWSDDMPLRHKGRPLFQLRHLGGRGRGGQMLGGRSVGRRRMGKRAFVGGVAGEARRLAGCGRGVQDGGGPSSATDPWLCAWEQRSRQGYRPNLSTSLFRVSGREAVLGI